MMLDVKTKSGFLPLENRSNFNIVRDYEGDLTLSFDIRTNDSMNEYLMEEAQLRFDTNLYKITAINKRKVSTSISAKVDLDDWKEKMWIEYDHTYALFSEIMLEVAPEGWVIEEAGTVTGRNAFHYNGATSYEILMECKKLYGIVYEFHTAEKRIKAIKPDVVQSRGLYITDELNLNSLEFKGSSKDFCTRLYGYGKRTETKDEEGNVTSVSYVTFADINDGKSYVDNNEYSDRTISVFWHDDRYTDPQSLFDDTVDKLKSLARPERSYSCNLVDLSRVNEKYRMLDFEMYDKVTLMDSNSHTCVQHQIVQYTDYPDNPNLNKVVLSSVFKKITGTIDGIKQSISSIDTEVKRTESSINEIIRDVESNTLRIQNTYTKGETDVQIENIVQQTANELTVSIGKVEEQGEKLQSDFNDLSVTVDGLFNKISSTGGNNLILNSMGVYGDGWTGNWIVDKSQEVKQRNIYGFAILLQNGELYQSISVPNGSYVLSFQYIKHIALSNVTLKVNDAEFVLSSEEYAQFKLPLEVETGTIEIYFIADTDNACTICNLMLNQGTEAMIWSLNANETWSDMMRMSSSGLEIDAAQSDVLFNAKADIIGFKNKNTGEYVAIFTDTGAEMNEIIVKKKARIVGVLFQDINGHTALNYVGGDD